MTKVALVYGLIVGTVNMVAMMAALFLLDPATMSGSEWLGYLSMIVAFSFVFVGIRRYRDRELGGVIRFGTAMKVGLGIVLVASLMYVIVWEINLAATDYAFMEDYAASVVAERAAEGASPEEVEAVRAEMTVMTERYRNPLFRLGITFLEIFPVGLVVALISAAILRRPEVLPAG